MGTTRLREKEPGGRERRGGRERGERGEGGIEVKGDK